MTEDELIRAFDPRLRRMVAKFGPNDDDGMQAARIGMLKAIRSFDPDAGSFDNHFWRWVWASLREERRRRERVERTTRGLEAQMREAPETTGEWPHYDDLLHADDLLCTAGGLMNARETEILMSWLGGERGTEIARHRGVSRQRVGQVVGRAIEKLQHKEPPHKESPLRQTGLTLEQRLLALVSAEPRMLSVWYAAKLGVRTHVVRGSLRFLTSLNLVQRSPQHSDRWRTKGQKQGKS